MEELYTLGFEGQLTTKGKDKWFKAMKWDYWDEEPNLGGWYVHCEAPTADKEKFDDLKVIGNNEDYVDHGYLELREVSHFRKSRRYDRLINYACFNNIWNAIINWKRFYHEGEEENMEETKELEPTSAECCLNLEGEKERLEKLKKDYANLYKKIQGEIVADCAQWSVEEDRAVVLSHFVAPDNFEELRHQMREIAFDMLQAQNMIDLEEERRRYDCNKEDELAENED